MCMLENFVKENYGKNLGQLSLDETYAALLKLVQEKAGQKEIQGKKKLYYISAEFLIGKLLSNNLINLGIYDQIDQELKAAGKSLAQLEEGNLNLLWETAAWADWQHAFWIPLPAWDCTEMVLD